MDYKYNEHGEITNVKPIVDTGDFRAYPVETDTKDGDTVTYQVCCELIDGRWEYFISFPTKGEA